MEIIPDVAERVTALTDFMMAVVAIIGMVQFRRDVIPASWKINLWTAVYLLFIAAALIGTFHHGLVLSTTAYDLSWLLIILCLGMMIGLFVVALTYDVFGLIAARKILPVMIVIALGFFGFSWSQGQDFSLFLAYEAFGLLAALIGYSYLAFLRRPGGLSLAIAVFITIVAAVVQATKAMSYTIVVPFDHNANYHLIQIVGVMLLTHGIRQSVNTSSAQSQQ